MDPDYVFNLYKLAVRDGDKALAADYMASLRQYMANGGYAPLGWR
jgi:hypothetical protein